MSQHTPGPWTVQPLLGGQFKFHNINGPDGKVVVFVSANSFGGKEVKDGWTRARWDDCPNAPADAALIAAAPEMLEALKQIAEWPGAEADDDALVRVAIARRAIAKATAVTEAATEERIAAE